MREELGAKSVSRVNARTKPIRGIDWAEIFERRPELDPPGYQEAVEYMRASRAAKMRGDA